MKRQLLIAICSTGLVGLAACGDPVEEPVPAPIDDQNNDPGGKTDTPEGKDTPENQCLDRQDDVLNSAQ